jgi:hypothetical protein
LSVVHRLWSVVHLLKDLTLFFRPFSRKDLIKFRIVKQSLECLFNIIGLSCLVFRR